MTSKNKEIDLCQTPEQSCSRCHGKGEIYSHSTFWGQSIYKTCPKCNGSGKPDEIKLCVKCSQKLTDCYPGWACVNRSCDNFGLTTVGTRTE